MRGIRNVQRRAEGPDCLQRRKSLPLWFVRQPSCHDIAQGHCWEDPKAKKKKKKKKEKKKRVKKVKSNFTQKRRKRYARDDRVI